jgi:hypothetical protein
LKKAGRKLDRTVPEKKDPEKMIVPPYVQQKIEGELIAGGDIIAIDEEDEMASLQIANYNIETLSQFDDNVLKVENIRKSGKIRNGKREGKSTNILTTQPYPVFYRMYLRWYKDGRKRLPSRWKPTPTVMRQVFVSYGGRKGKEVYFHTTLCNNSEPGNTDTSLSRLISRLREVIPGTEYEVQDGANGTRKVIIVNPAKFFEYIQTIPVDTYNLDIETYEYKTSRCPKCGSPNYIDTGRCQTCYDCAYSSGTCSVSQ